MVGPHDLEKTDAAVGTARLRFSSAIAVEATGVTVPVCRRSSWASSPRFPLASSEWVPSVGSDMFDDADAPAS